MALNITLDTYKLHDYFLFYSPVLLAAASIHLALSSILHLSPATSAHAHPGSESAAYQTVVPANDAATLNDNDKEQLNQALQSLVEVFQLKICPKIARYAADNPSTEVAAPDT